MPKLPIAFEEIAPGRYLLRDARVAAFVRSEGTLEGPIFTLTSQRGDGMLARLRERGFGTLTLADRIAALPSPARRTGPPLRRTIGKGERIAQIDPQTLSWVTLSHLPGQLVELPGNAIVRIRQGRGAAIYLIGAQPVDEQQALLAAYALASGGVVPSAQRPDGLLLAAIPLPQPYLELLSSIGQPLAEGTLVPPACLPLARALFARLGVALDRPDESKDAEA